MSLNVAWATTKNHQSKHPRQENRDGKQGYLKPEICSIVHKHHQCPQTHIISAPRATHQPNGCQVMNDMSQKILGRREKHKGKAKQVQLPRVCVQMK